MDRKTYYYARISFLTAYCKQNNIELPYVNKRFKTLRDYSDYCWELQQIVDNFHDSLVA